MANNFVSNANATNLMNAINQKKDTKPDTITWAEWIQLTDQEREGTHYIITDVPAQFSLNDAIFSLKNQTLVFTNKVATITDSRITSNAYLFTFYANEAVAQAAGIECSWSTGTITFTVVNDPVSDITLDILAILPALAPGGGSGEGGHTIVGPTGTEMAQEDKLQFTGYVTVTDDSTNGKTIVNITGGGHTIQNSQGTNVPPRSTMQFADAFLSDDSSALKTKIHMMQQAMTRAAFEDAQNLPDGMYPIKEEDPTVISADMVAYGDGTVEQALNRVDRGSVSVNVTTSMTYAQALASLYSDADFTKISENGALIILGNIYRVTIVDQNNAYVFSNFANGSASSLKLIEVKFVSGTPYLYEYDIYNHTRQDILNGYCWKNGTIELVY